MKRSSENSGRMKVLTSEELAHVIGGTGDPSKPIGDPGETGNYGDMDAIAQNWNGQR